MHFHLIDTLGPALGHMGTASYWIVFVAAFFEAVAFIGTLIPGATVVTLAGFLASQGYLDLGDLFWFAAIGAIMGDGLSYYLGSKGTRFFKDENKILKASHIDRGKSFFKKHGMKSLLLGRFVGPLRAIIPFVAGLSHMDTKTFFFWDVMGGSVWALSHLLLGYFFGGAFTSIHIWSKRGAIFVGAFVLVGAVIWFIMRHARYVLRVCGSIVAAIREEIVSSPVVKRMVASNPQLFSFLARRTSMDTFVGLPLTVLVAAFIYIFFLLIGIFEGVLGSDMVATADIQIENLLYAARDPLLIKIFLWITLAGNAVIVSSVVLVSSLVLYVLGKRAYVIGFWVSVVGNEACVVLGKLLVHRARPGGHVPFYIEHSYSFPSGHATVAVALYAFLAYVVMREARRWQHGIYTFTVATLFVLGLGVSRLYLGVHYASDVIGGYLLGALWLIIGITISEWLKTVSSIGGVSSARTQSAGIRFISGTIIGAEVFFFVNFAIHFSPPQNLLQETEVGAVVNEAQALTWSDRLGGDAYTHTLVGATALPITIIIIAKDDETVRNSIEQASWLAADSFTPRSMERILKRRMMMRDYPQAPITPLFWNYMMNDLGFEKSTSIRSQHHRVRLWKTNLAPLDASSTPGNVYLGTASRDIGWALSYDTLPEIDVEREAFFDDLLRTGTVSDFHKEQLTSPTVDETIAGDGYTSDGAAYVIYLK